MSLKDEIIAMAADVAAKARAQKDLEASLRDTMVGLQAQIDTMTARITELEGDPGPWTDADMAEIKAALVALHDAYEPGPVVDAVVDNTEFDPSAN